MNSYAGSRVSAGLVSSRAGTRSRLGVLAASSRAEHIIEGYTGCLDCNRVSEGRRVLDNFLVVPE